MSERHTGRRAFLAGVTAAVAGCGARTTGTDDQTDDTRTTTDTQSTTVPATPAEAGPDDISLPDDAAWPSFGGTTGNRGSLSLGPGPSTPPTPAWRTDVKGTYTMPGPAVADELAFVGSGTKAYAFDAHTGETRWRAELEVLTHHFSPTVHGEQVLFGAQPASTIQPGSEGRLAAFSLSGERAWTRTFPVTTDPTVVGERVIVGESASSEAAVRAIDPGDGSDLWRVPLSAVGVRGAPAADEELAVVTAATDDAGLLVGVSPDGERQFTTQLQTGARAAPILLDETILVQRNDGTLVAFDRSGEQRWTVNAGERAASAPVVAGDRIVALVENTLAGVTRDGTLDWQTAIGTTLINGVTVSDDTAYVGGSSMSAVSLADGEKRWSVPVPGESGAFGAPVVVGNTAFVGVCIKDEPGDLYDDFMYAFV